MADFLSDLMSRKELIEEYYQEYDSAVVRIYLSCFIKTEQGVIKIKEFQPPSNIAILKEIQSSGTSSSRFVTLDTVEIFTTHEWFGKPTVYFRCNGENKTRLSDVKEAKILYTFKGEESWQPLTELPEKKCKRCGLYEEDTFKPADVFDEWEMCSSYFKDGKYTPFKENQFNATFLCPNCTASAGDYGNNERSEVDTKKASVPVIIVVSVLASVLVIIALFGGYKYCQKKKRERDQARFLKLF